MADAESGLIYMRARYYEPSTGRFISEDPARDGRNWFVYANNDPIKFRDFSGKSFFEFQMHLFGAFANARMKVGLSAEAAVAWFIKEAMAVVKHFYLTNIAMAMKLEYQAKLLIGEALLRPPLAEWYLRGADACRSIAARHRFEAFLIRAYGIYEIQVYAVVLQLSYGE